MLLPRLAGVAERAWSPAPGARWPEYRDRLAPQARLWSTRGWTFFSSSLVDW
jgi:hexosaminidase